MIDLGEKSHCICQKLHNAQAMCVNEYTIREKGKSVKLAPAIGEQAMAIIIDGCMIKDNDPKCDALFLYQSTTRKYSFLVEIKGKSEIDKAFAQLRYTRDNRVEYQRMLTLFQQRGAGSIIQRFAIVSNAQLTKVEREKLENRNGIRVRKILHCEATTPIPDLKELI